MMEIHHMDKSKHAPQKMASYIHKFEVGSLAANQILNKGHHKTPLWVKQTHAQQLVGLLANIKHLTLRQHQRYDVNVETNVLKASLPEQIKHCGNKHWCIC